MYRYYSFVKRKIRRWVHRLKFRFSFVKKKLKDSRKKDIMKREIYQKRVPDHDFTKKITIKYLLKFKEPVKDDRSLENFVSKSENVLDSLVKEEDFFKIESEEKKE